ncbi:unnamed protein product [Amoebophrya sp. A25]|nr:unnamed protein product [Amoebophrya sp. A25]|eukprot:GSA25T00012342001.1
MSSSSNPPPSSSASRSNSARSQPKTTQHWRYRDLLRDSYRPGGSPRQHRNSEHVALGQEHPADARSTTTLDKHRTRNILASDDQLHHDHGSGRHEDIFHEEGDDDYTEEVDPAAGHEEDEAYYLDEDIEIEHDDTHSEDPETRHLARSTFVDYGDISIQGMAFTYFAVGILKMIAVAFCTAAGGSGGFFAPSMIIGGYFGGALGSVLKWISGPHEVNGTYLQLCVLFGMVGFFASSFRLPLTGALCIYELIVASTDDESNIAGSHIVSRLFFPMLVCSIVSFCLSIYMHPQALLERTMEQDGLHNLCFGNGSIDGESSSEDETSTEDSSTSDTKDESAEKEVEGTTDGLTVSSLKSADNKPPESILGLVSKTLLPPELKQSGSSRRQSVDLGQVFRKPLYETGSFAGGSAQQSSRSKNRRSIKGDGTSPEESPDQDTSNTTGSRSSRNASDIPEYLKDTGAGPLTRIRRASHPPASRISKNTSERIVDFYRRNSVDIRKEFEALKANSANLTSTHSTSSKRSYNHVEIPLPDRGAFPLGTGFSSDSAVGTVKTISPSGSISCREAPGYLQSGRAGFGGGTGDAGGDNSPPSVPRELNLGGLPGEDLCSLQHAAVSARHVGGSSSSKQASPMGLPPDDAISVALSIGQVSSGGAGSTVGRGGPAGGPSGAPGGGSNRPEHKRGGKRNTKVNNSTSTMRILENAMKRRGEQKGSDAISSTISSAAGSDGIGVLGGGGSFPGGQPLAPAGGVGGGFARPSGIFHRGRSGSISTTPGQMWRDMKEFRESKAENKWNVLASMSEEDMPPDISHSQRSLNPKPSLSMSSSSQFALPSEIVYPQSVPEEEEN